MPTIEPGLEGVALGVAMDEAFPEAADEEDPAELAVLAPLMPL